MLDAGEGRGDELYGVEPASFYVKNLVLNTSISFPLAVALPFLAVFLYPMADKVIFIASPLYEEELKTDYFVGSALQLVSLMLNVFQRVSVHCAGGQVGTETEAPHVLPGATVARAHVLQAPQGDRHRD